MSYTSAEQETKHVDPSCTSYDYYSILRTVSEHTEKQGVRKMIEAMITPTLQHKEGDKVTVFLSLTTRTRIYYTQGDSWPTLIWGRISSSPSPALHSQVSSNLHLFARGRPYIPPNWYLNQPYFPLIKGPIFNSIWIYLPQNSFVIFTKLSPLWSLRRGKSRTGYGERRKNNPGQVQVCSIPFSVWGVCID